ncbi:MAG TPA: DUF4143 domain-containing protein [Longimicrobiales bacterium]|nr:DUF4143 domain-containing protein [Longimicrobiales bacterium]
MKYERRILDDELDALLQGLAAVALEGPKAVGKTATALQRAGTVYRLDDPAQAEVAMADPGRLARGREPIVIDEWQRVGATWDVVRRAVDEDPRPGRFLLTGSASPASPPTHSGAGRIVRVRMRPLSLAERGLAAPTVSLGRMLGAPGAPIRGETPIDLETYAEEIVRSGFPGMRALTGRALRTQLDGYIDRIVDHDFEEMGHKVRRPGMLRRWLAAYAAATATTSTIEAIRDAATSNEGDKPARATVLSYREVLGRLWILDPVPAWVPSRNPLSRLAYPEKHHIADPALAARLLGIDLPRLIEGGEGSVTMPRDGSLLGHLFESLVAQSVRIYAQAAEATVGHLRTKGGRQEVDLVVERADGRVVALEVKLARTVTDHDVRHLLWLREQIGQDLLDAAIITTSPSAYRRTDGIAVIPAALLGP